MSNILTVNGADMFPGEIRTQGFLVTHEGSPVTPSSASYQRYKDGVVIDQAPIPALISDNKVYANISAGSTLGIFAALFSYTVDTQTVKTRVMYRVVKPSV